tara:strand:+ start:1454 stop:2680 length:1227 start_codon:yes stop_codon:yes gene_type:complete
MKKIIIIDTSYTLTDFENRGSLNVIYARDLGKYFEKVYSIHPLADLTNKKLILNKKYYKFTKLNNIHYFYEFSCNEFKKFRFLNPFIFIYFQSKMIFKIIRLINDEKINFIKGGDSLYAGLIALILSKITKKNLFIRVGSNNNKIRHEIKKPIQKKFYQFIFIERFFEKIIVKHSSHIFPANYDNEKYINSIYKCSHKSTVIRYGPLINDCHYIDPRKRVVNSKLINEIISNNEKLLIFISRLEKEKLIFDVVDVFKKLSENHNNIKLIIIGDGSQKNNLKKCISKYNLDKKIVLVGEKKQIWISEILSVCTLVLSPHTGRALCEASLAGSLIVAYDIDWQSEIIEHYKSGFLVEYKNIDKMFYYSNQILNNYKKYSTLGFNLRNKALEILDKEKSTKDEINVYNKFI